MKANDLLDMIGNVSDNIIKEAEKKENAAPRWTKWIAVAACLCLVAVGSFKTLQRFDYAKGAGCSAMPGTIVDGEYYYKVDHSGVWRYSDGATEKVLNTFWEDGWLVNRYGLFYKLDKSLYRMDLETLERKAIYSATEGTHIGFDLAQDGNIIVTVYDSDKRWKYQVLVNGSDGSAIEQLTDKISYDSYEPTYSMLHYHVGDRQIDLKKIGGDPLVPHYMPTENGLSLLPDGRWLFDYGYEHVDRVLFFDVYQSDEPIEEETERLILFADGKTLLEPRSGNYSGAIGHTLLYVDYDSPKNYGSNGNGIWCYDTDTGDRWQLKIDADCEFYAFKNDDQMLYSCVPWSEEQTAWKIVYEGNKPVSLQLIDNNITD